MDMYTEYDGEGIADLVSGRRGLNGFLDACFGFSSPVAMTYYLHP